MPLQNRVTPHGEIVAIPERGAWCGNRGIIHNNRKEIVRQHAAKAWIICKVDFRNRRRTLMGNGWTELFFFDEATALAAGHRPCHYCRRADARRFLTSWIEGNADHVSGAKKFLTPAMDAVLHRERRTFPRPTVAPGAVPNGAMAEWSDAVHLRWGGRWHLWTPSGYESAAGRAPRAVTLLTPPSTVAAIECGFVPQVDESVAG